MIDIDRLICDLFTIEFDEEEKKNLKHKYDPQNAYAPIYMVQHAIYKALEKQGLEYIDGEIIELNPVFKPEKGEWYMCIKTVVMTPGGETAYKKGKIYKSEGDNFITDEQGETCHCWYEECDVFHKLYEHFRPATEKEILRLAPLTDEQRAYIEEGLKNGSIIREKDLAYAEPKFKIGDWIVYTGYLLKDSGKEIYVMQVASVENDRYNFTDTSTLCFDSEKDMRLWTIKDAKAGDILAAENGWTCIFREVRDFDFASYCFMDASCCFFPKGGKCHTLDSKFGGKMYPATKEQREKFEKVMNNAGYTWNQEELKLEKIDKPDIAYVNGAISSEDEQGIDKSSCTSTKENNNPQTIKFNESEDTDSVWPKEVVDELLEETQKYTPKIKEELRKYIANNFPYLYKVDVEKMTRDYCSGLLHCGYVGPSYFDRQIAYKRGLEDMLKLIKEGGSNESID